MANYYIGDCHFGHENVIRFDHMNGSRSFLSIEEHDNLIIENINKIVTPQDNLYFIGDISWVNSQKTIELLSQIKCHNLYAIKGNHDNVLKDGKIKEVFQGIYDIKEIDDNGRRVFLCHYPVMMWKNQHSGTIHIYSHLHNTKEHDDYKEFLKELDERIKVRDGLRYKPIRAFNAGCMLWDYKPVTLDEMMERSNEFRAD